MYAFSDWKVEGVVEEGEHKADFADSCLSYKLKLVFEAKHVIQNKKLFKESVTMLERHYSRLTPMLLAEEFAGFRFDAKQKTWNLPAKS